MGEGFEGDNVVDIADARRKREEEAGIAQPKGTAPKSENFDTEDQTLHIENLSAMSFMVNSLTIPNMTPEDLVTLDDHRATFDQTSQFELVQTANESNSHHWREDPLRYRALILTLISKGIVQQGS